MSCDTDNRDLRNTALADHSPLCSPAPHVVVLLYCRSVSCTSYLLAPKTQRRTRMITPRIVHMTPPATAPAGGGS